MLTPDQIVQMLSQDDGGFRMARWRRPIAPVVFGADDATLDVFRAAIKAVAELVGHPIEDIDAEQGANLMVFLFKDWSEVADVPDIEGLVPGMVEMTTRLAATRANQYRHFRFEKDGAIRAGFVFLCLDAELSALPAADVALGQAVQIMTLWGSGAFRSASPLAYLHKDGPVAVRPECALLMKAIYHPTMPVVSDDPVQAHRLAARMQVAANAVSPEDGGKL